MLAAARRPPASVETGRNDTSPWRLFVALAIPTLVRDALGQAQAQLQAAGVRAAWVRPEAMHLTLHFLGNTPTTRVADIAAACERAAARVPPVHLRIAGMDSFPTPRRPRVIVAGVQGKAEQLRRLHGRLARLLPRAGARVDTRPLRPHVTLGRLRRPPPAPALAALREILALPPATYGDFSADSVDLIRSELQPGGAVYTVLASAPLLRPQGADVGISTPADI